MIVETSRFINLVKDNNNVKYLAYCGTASNTKDGVDKLIRSFKYVNNKYPEIFLYIIGKVPSDKEKNENYNFSLTNKINNLWGSLSQGRVTDISIAKI